MFPFSEALDTQSWWGMIRGTLLKIKLGDKCYKVEGSIPSKTNNKKKSLKKSPRIVP